MGKAFFIGWDLWEKMVFVLACSVVVTILAGCCKLIYDHYRMRKYLRLPPKIINLNREKSIIRSLSRRSAKTPMIQRRPRLIKDGIEIPFGIRALESGIEVDGVWISRTDPPHDTSASRHAFANSVSEHLPNQSVAHACRRYPIKSGTAISRPVSDPIVDFSSPSAGQTISHSSSQDVSIAALTTSEMSQTAALRYPPHSYLRYENGKHFRRSRGSDSSETPSRPVSSHDSGSRDGKRSSSLDSGQRAGSTSSGDILAPYQVHPVARPRNVNHAALDMLQAHRLSHAAETGQLIPRVRKPGQSRDSGDGRDYNLLRSSSDFSTSLGSSVSYQSNPFATPASGKLPSSDILEPQSTASDNSFNSSEPLPAVHRAGSIFGRVNDFSILREVNSGFSVLRPGTLDAELRSRTASRQRSASPSQRRRSRSVSFDLGPAEKKRSRRLQKRRPSEDSASNRTSVTLDDDTQSSAAANTVAVMQPDQSSSAKGVSKALDAKRHEGSKFSFEHGSRPGSAFATTEGAAAKQGDM